MVSVRDEWGHDPSVQLMRRVFQQMEAVQAALLRQIGIAPFDARLRKARELARDDFERIWPIALERGTLAGEEKASVLYVHCFARALGMSGITIPADVLAKDETITTFLREVLP